MASKVGAFLSVLDFLSCMAVAKQPCYGPLKIKRSSIIVHYIVLMQFVYYGSPPTAMNAVLDIIANGGLGIIVIFREAVEKNIFLNYSL